MYVGGNKPTSELNVYKKKTTSINKQPDSVYHFPICAF